MWFEMSNVHSCMAQHHVNPSSDCILAHCRVWLLEADKQLVCSSSSLPAKLFSAAEVEFEVSKYTKPSVGRIRLKCDSESSMSRPTLFNQITDFEEICAAFTVHMV